MIPDDTATMLATQVNSFAYYADAYLANPSAALPQGVASSLTSNDAVSLIENTYNFIYLEDATNCLADSQVSTVITLNKNVAGKINIQEIASGYNSSFTTIKNAFNSFLPNDKKFSIVDVELLNESSTNAQFSIKAQFKWNVVTPETWMTTSTGSVFPTVPNGDYWHKAPLGGKYGTTYYDYIMGSPEIIVRYVKAYLGYYTTTSPVRFKVPTGVKADVSTNPAKPTSLPPTYYAIDPKIPPGDPITPDATRPGVSVMNCLYSGHTWDKYSPPFLDPPYQKYLTGYAVNYHITETPNLLDRAKIASGKSLWDFTIKPVVHLEKISKKVK
ncbi:MAG: hypothetical protein QM530_04095 [Phycisphaerales bacterium]|nr:hypothetical protein [Phycisphaerales bacterium]